MNTKDIKKKQAKAYKYFMLGLNSKEISKLIDTSFRTIQNWIFIENWKQKRKEQQ